MAMPIQRIRFTKRTIEAIKPPSSGNRYYRDTGTRGLELIATASGYKAFYLARKIDGRSTRLRVGAFPETTVEQARRQAAVLNGRIAKGENPARERQRIKSEATFGELFDIYLEQYAKPHKRTWPNDQSMYNCHLGGLKNRRLRDIRKADVGDLHAKIGRESPYAANRVVALVRKVYNYAIDQRGWEGANPCRGIKKFTERRRMRFLEAPELKRFFAALAAEPNETFRDYFAVLLLTGARRGNVAAMRWVDVNLDRGVWIVPGEQSKNGEPLKVVLVDPVVRILKRRAQELADEARETQSEKDAYVFRSKFHAKQSISEHKFAWSRILKAAGLDDVRPHDLRRTLAVWQNLVGSSPLVIRDSLGQRTLQALDHYAHTPAELVRSSVERATREIMKHGGKALIASR